MSTNEQLESHEDNDSEVLLEPQALVDPLIGSSGDLKPINLRMNLTR